MPTHAERRVLPYTPREMFELVAAVDRYPEFLPWCVAARVNKNFASAQAQVHRGEIVRGHGARRSAERASLDRRAHQCVSGLDLHPEVAQRVDEVRADGAPHAASA